MSWITQIVLVICITTIVHKIISEISLSKFNKK
jgi:hypothetical protein